LKVLADIHRRGDNQLRVETPPYRVNQTIMYRTIAPSKHHKNCIPKKKGKNSTTNEIGGQRYIPATPQTPGNRICFDFCQEGHDVQKFLLQILQYQSIPSKLSQKSHVNLPLERKCLRVA
jgi:hypothetical protein